MLNRVSRSCFCSAAAAPTTPSPWLFVGLGNPGEKFKGTRHNVGFEMIDAFSESVGISMNVPLCKALFGEGFVGDAPVLLAKPQTYMNLSGESVSESSTQFSLSMAGPLAAYYKLPLNRVIVFHDDLELPCGVLRLQEKGGHGCHKGLKSVINHFRGNREFARLRIGIGRPPGQMDPKAFLLQKFNATARERIDAALPEGVVALRCILHEGLAGAARWFNQEQKYKYMRSETMSA
ncbi:PEPTIDYL-TRNA HYDROLASE [Salix purpurea]|uniref:PEPTIDYL-TRNA HYDROLASE n=1 Tax=Salix purpurea TaxID=77065 RepID=A0A9Q0TKQ6_SALPP|nr:PEPTIDYL-TRNA HYDROLASE [Salix purpurea]